MKKGILIFISLLSTLIGSSQEVVSTQGDSYSNGNSSIDFTIGEVVVNTGTDGTNDITQGFHQTNWNVVGVENQVPSFEATVFPNPTSELLNIRASTFKNVTYTLYDGQGKFVLQEKLIGNETSIQVSDLATGNYSLILNNETENLKTFKLIKTH